VAAPNIGYYLNGKQANYVHINERPDPKYCATALYALKCYYEFSRTSPEGEPKILWSGKGGSGSRNADWYQLGIDVLDGASSVLQHFNYAPEAQKPVAEKLADLRSLARSVAGLISGSSSVRDSYFVGNRVATHDELSHTIDEHPNIFRCEVNWGCYWQERPEDGIALYRELMNSPVFCYIHKDFWKRSPIQPRLIAWNQADQKRIPQVWADFVRELNASTNVLLRMEAQALAMADASNRTEAQLAEQEWWTIVRSNRDELVANNVELFYLGWGVVYNSETEAMDREYWNKTVPAQKTLAAFGKQKEFLTTYQPYDFRKFVDTFREKNYSRAQALEIQPLLAAYKSNLVTQSQIATLRQKGQFMGAISRVSFLENDVSRILNPPAPASSPTDPPSPATSAASQPALAASKAAGAGSNQAPEIATNVLVAKKFLPIPIDGLPGDKKTAPTITAHHWIEGKLVLDFQYGAFVYSFDGDGNWQRTRGVTFPAIAILDPATERWQVISCPEVDAVSQNRFYHHTTLCRGEVFTSDGGRIKKYDDAKTAWQVLDISDVGNCELFTVYDHLYAATPNLIMEIMDGGTRTRILASNRRQPPVSALDTENLGTPALFAGPGRSLRAAAGNKIVTWDGEDWRTVCSAPQAPTPPLISDDGVLFLADGWDAPAGLWRLATDDDHVEFWLGQAARRGMGAAYPGSNENSMPAWKLPPGFSMIGLAAASRGRDLYLMNDHANSQNIVNEQEHLIIGKKILPQDGYHAELLCFSGGDPAPQKIFIRFDSEDASLPVTGDNRAAGFKVPNRPSSWLLFSTHYLFCGRETFGAISSGGGDSRRIPTQTGVWMIPLERIDPEIARNRKTRLEQPAHDSTLAKKTSKMLVEKYDTNHNGVIDREEKETALDDPAFIAMELDAIDANHNGWLEAVELAYYDANTNKMLEPKEQVGIEIAQHLLAERLFKKFDTNGDGWLDRPEFDECFHASLAASVRSIPGMAGMPTPFPDDNHDRLVDLGELETFLNQQTHAGLRSRGMPGAPYFSQMRMNASQSADPGQMFKAAVETYWQSPGGNADRLPANRRPPAGGAITNSPRTANP
jgi:Ca2+-binding EF-hand superfamily protein